MSTPFPDKPKGMHWRTYERLCREHDALSDLALAGNIEFFTKFQTHLKSGNRG